MKKLTISNQQKFFSLINQKGKICARLTYQIFRDKNGIKETTTNKR